MNSNIAPNSYGSQTRSTTVSIVRRGYVNSLWLANSTLGLSLYSSFHLSLSQQIQVLGLELSHSATLKLRVLGLESSTTQQHKYLLKLLSSIVLGLESSHSATHVLGLESSHSATQFIPGCFMHRVSLDRHKQHKHIEVKSKS